MQRLFASALQWSSWEGQLAFSYPNAWDLWREAMVDYRSILEGQSRRSGALSLGEYTLAEFNLFYAALMSVCAVHEFMCFAWWKNQHRYPLESAVVVRDRDAWVELLAELSGVALSKCAEMVRDMTFDFAHSDLHVRPFVPLDAENSLAIAPQFPLHSRHDENALRVCSLARPTVFSVTSSAKESEMRAALLSASRRPLAGPVNLPKPFPDIDLVVSDETCSTVLIAELKWARKSMRPVEAIERDGEVRKGLDQLKRIRECLEADPDLLMKRGVLQRTLSAYQVRYLVVARDHWLWAEPRPDGAIIEFEVFADALRRDGALDVAIGRLLTYEWLPIEGRDFVVQYDRATLNGVSVEAEVFYPVSAASPPP